MRLELQQLRQALLAVNAAGRGGPEPPAAARCAAVAAVLRPSADGAEVLLIRRAEHERDPWSGHMALPGGHRKEGDLDLVATALRETHEEVGFALDREAEWIGWLERVRPFSSPTAGFEIVPLVFVLARDVELRLNPREVKAVVWAKIDHLLSPAAQTSFAYPAAAGGERPLFPAFDVDGHVVWGLTYRILKNLLAVWGWDDPR
jgi:8-oxo-dGTP pyrophosphatase MutT (NUDIX family)